MTDLPAIVSLEAFERATTALLASGYKSRYGAVPWCDLNKPGPEHRWLIKGLLASNGVAICAGESKSGKSFLMTDLALHVALDRLYQGRKVDPGLVIYQAGEGGLGLKKRLRALKAQYGVGDDEDVPFVLLPGAVNLHATEDGTDQFIAEIQHWQSVYPDAPLRMVVVDTLSAATPGANENASEHMSLVVSRCARIAERCGCLVVLVHHMNKAGGAIRGHSSLVGNVENTLQVARLDLKDDNGRPIRRVELTKNKDGEDGFLWRFVLKQEVVGYDADGEKITTCIVEAPAGESTAPEGAKAFTARPNEVTFLQALFAALETDAIAPPADLDVPPSVTAVVDYKAVKAEFRKISPHDEPDERLLAERLKKSLQRAREGLQRCNVIGAHNPYIWWTGRQVSGIPQSFRAQKKPGAEKAGDNGGQKDMLDLSPQDDLMPF